MHIPSVLRLAVTVCGIILSVNLTAMASELSKVTIQEGLNFFEDAQQARKEGRLIMLLVSQDHCPFCVLIKEEIIYPMIRGGDYKDELLIREIFIDLDRPAVDFAGHLGTAKIFADKYGADLTPTLLFLAPDGKELTERMVGINTPEMYFYYVDESIKQALEQLK